VHESRQHADGLGITVVEKTLDGLLKIHRHSRRGAVQVFPLPFNVELAVTATFRAWFAFAATIRAFDFGDVDDPICRFFIFLFMKNFHLAEKPQGIIRTVAVPDEPLMETRIGSQRTSPREDVSTAKTRGATVLFDPTALAFGADRPKFARRTTFTVQELANFSERKVALSFRVRDAVRLPAIAASDAY